MSSKFLEILYKYTMVLIAVMFIKIFVVDIKPDLLGNIDDFNTLESSIISYTMIFDTKDTTKNNFTFERPSFEIDDLENFVTTYIEENSCTSLEYNVFDLGRGRVNVYLNCGTPKSLLYNYTSYKPIDFDTIIINDNQFQENVKKLVAKKYPSFVADDINFDTATYNIKGNELVGFYSTNEYGPVNIKINYNEIKDLLDFEMNYDDAYENEIFVLDKNKKTIAFTFDDGPSNFDLDIIDLLTNSHSKATFYVVGNRINNFQKSIKKMIETDMEVGNHTYDHKSLTGLSKSNMILEITKTNDTYNLLTGKNLTSLRPSYGSINKTVLVEVGMPVILWNIDTLDWKTRNKDKVYDEIINNANDGDIVLMHSLYKSTVDAVDASLKELYKRGFQVTSVGELARIKEVNLVPGKSYTHIK